MSLLGRKTEEERAAQTARKTAEAGEKERKRQVGAFFATPAGQARVAYARGEQAFQYAYNVMSQSGVVLFGKGRTAQRTSDPTAILNSVCQEGWELVNGSFVFVQTGETARMTSRHKVGIGEKGTTNIAISGQVIGYYLFKRCDANKLDVGNPWDAVEVQQTAECPWCDSEIPLDSTTCPVCENDVRPSSESAVTRA